MLKADQRTADRGSFGVVIAADRDADLLAQVPFQSSQLGRPPVRTIPVSARSATSCGWQRSIVERIPMAICCSESARARRISSLSTTQLAGDSADGVEAANLRGEFAVQRQ